MHRPLQSSNDRPPVPESHDEGEKKVKRARLSLACNECRKRKVKCDTEMPTCRNCKLRGKVCVTTDPRNPELTVYRKPPMKELRELMSPAAATEPVYPNVKNVIGHPSPSHELVRTAPSASRQPGFHTGLGERDAHVSQQFQNEHESPLALNSDQTRNRQKLMGRSSLQSLAMILDLHLSRVGLPCIAPSFGYGMHYVNDYPIPIRCHLPKLPLAESLNMLLDTYRRSIHPMFPIVDLAHLQTEIERLQLQADWREPGGTGLNEASIQAQDVPIMATIYTILSLGADEAAGSVTELGMQYLTAAYSLYAHLISTPYFSSVQALVLLCIAMRGRNKEGQGSHILASAVHIAHSIGLHRSAAKLGRQTPESSLNSRLWWTIFALEKMMEIETARPTMIRLSDVDQTLPRAEDEESKYLAHFVSLAIVMSQISDALYRAKRKFESASHLLQSIAVLDEALSNWRSSVPENLRPQSDLLCDDDELPFATFLSLQYYQALITLHRTALALAQDTYSREVEKLPPSIKASSRQKVKKGSELCIQAARAIVRLDAQLEDNNISSRLFVVTQTLLASVVVALHIIRQPNARMTRSDLEMLSNSTSYAETRYSAVGQDPKFTALCATLRSSMFDFVRYQRRTDDTMTESSNSPARQLMSPDSSRLSVPGAEDRLVGSYCARDGLDPFETVGLDDFWSALDPDLVLPDYIPGEGNFLNTFDAHLG